MTVGAWLLAGSLVGASLGGTLAQAGPPPGSRAPEGRAGETFRALAARLDEAARGALEGATDGAAQAASADGRFVSSIRAFAGRAGELRRAMDGPPTVGRDLQAEVVELTLLATRASDRLRAAGALEATDDDWVAVLDVLGRMRLVLTGHEVEVPAAHVVKALSGPSLLEFRRLAGEVLMRADRAQARAKRALADHPDRGPQLLGELGHFQGQVRELHRRAHAGPVRPQDMGPRVDAVLEDAREADRRLREAQVFRSIWDDSGGMIAALQQMTRLVRSDPDGTKAGPARAVPGT